MKPSLLFAMMAAGLGAISVDKPNKPKHKCLMPGCDNLTNHNGGYCSPECSKKHKQKGMK